MQLKNLKKFFTNPILRFQILNSRGFYKHLSDEQFLKKAFKLRMGYELNLESPKSFSEKLQWLKVYDRNPQYTRMVDKHEVKPYVADKIGEEYIIPTIGVWDSFDDIEFDKLPNQYVLKCTHDSGGVIIVTDKTKFDKEKAKKKINQSLKSNFYYRGREWPYKNVRPRIIAESYMMDKSGEDLNDYKLFCFNGKVKCTYVCTERYSPKGLHTTFFDRDWKVMPFERQFPSVHDGLPKPVGYEKMVELAEILSENIPFVRVDFYEINGQIYFGELTFFPGSGFRKFNPEKWDYILGDWIKLPSK